MSINVTHFGNDPMGAPTTHRGLLENCPAPECQDRVIEQEEAWGVYCPHGQRIVEPDPEADAGAAGQPIGRIVDPWPCQEEGCTLEAFERSERAREEEYYEALNEIARDVHR